MKNSVVKKVFFGIALSAISTGSYGMDVFTRFPRVRAGVSGARMVIHGHEPLPVREPWCSSVRLDKLTMRSDQIDDALAQAKATLDWWDSNSPKTVFIKNNPSEKTPSENSQNIDDTYSDLKERTENTYADSILKMNMGSDNEVVGYPKIEE